MLLNTLAPAPKSKKKARRLGRGFTRGKTCGRGHKGYKSRSGSSVPASFEGGQMPLQRRLPKVGFTCNAAFEHAEVRLSEINAAVKHLTDKEITVDLAFLKQHRIVNKAIRTAKVFLSGEISKAINLVLPVTKGAKKAVEAAGGTCKAIGS
tara:strand:+ start:2135 stop:2587 length:453 start_codon:yes stop_codon:yes gene_type:complete